MKKGGLGAEKGRNRAERGSSGKKERERDAVGRGAGEPREGRPPSAFEDTQVLSPIVFRCVVFCTLPAPRPRRLRSTPAARTFLDFYLRLFIPPSLGQPHGRRDSRCVCYSFSWVNGPCWSARELPGNIRSGDGEFIVASWVPLSSIRFRDLGS